MFQIPGCGLLEPIDPLDRSHTDHDSRGLIKIYEPPNPRYHYSMGIDVSNGLTNWSRELRTDADTKTDNGAIEIVRRGIKTLGDGRDVQAAEFAAPLEPEDLADVGNFLGRLYAGADDTGQCPCIIEVWPGPGLRTQREMINRYHYYNMFVWKHVDTMVSKPTNALGWTTSPKSLRDLWGRTSRHIKRRQVNILSPWLLEEMANISMRPDLLWGEAVGRKHDDRLRAFMLALWSLHDWAANIDLGDQQGVEQTKRGSWQNTACTVDEMLSDWEERWNSMAEDTQ
jgi:hypothetical protein